MTNGKYFNELRDIVQSIGKIGTAEYERYIDLPSEIPVNTRWSLYQLCFFADDASLLAYALEKKHNEGKFYKVTSLPPLVKKELYEMLVQMAQKDILYIVSKLSPTEKDELYAMYIQTRQDTKEK